MKIGFLGQFLLTPFEIPAIFSDVLAQDFSVFGDFGHFPRKPETLESATVYALYFVLAFFRHFPDCCVK